MNVIVQFRYSSVHCIFKSLLLLLFSGHLRWTCSVFGRLSNRSSQPTTSCRRFRRIKPEHDNDGRPGKQNQIPGNFWKVHCWSQRIPARQMKNTDNVCRYRFHYRHWYRQIWNMNNRRYVFAVSVQKVLKRATLRAKKVCRCRYRHHSTGKKCVDISNISWSLCFYVLFQKYKFLACVAIFGWKMNKCADIMSELLPKKRN